MCEFESERKKQKTSQFKFKELQCYLKGVEVENILCDTNVDSTDLSSN